MPVAPESDFALYHQVSQWIADGAWLPNSYGWIFGGPGYPLLLAALEYVGGGLASLRVLNILLQLGMVGGVWCLGRRTFGPSAGLLAAGIAAVFPGLWVYTPLVAPENLAMLLLTVVALLVGSSRPSMGVAAGTFAAFLAYSRPAYLYLVPVLAIVILVFKQQVRWQSLGWYLLGVGLIVAPLGGLNLVHHGPIVPADGGGWQIWLVNNERATGSWFPAREQPDYPFKDLELGPDQAVSVPSAQFKLGMQYVLANPVEALRGAKKRHLMNWEGDGMGIYWTVDRSPVAWQDHVPLHEHLYALFNGFYTAIIVLATITIVRCWRRPSLLWPIVAPLAYVIPIFLLAEGNGRYHAVVLPLLSVLAGAAFVPVRRLARTLAIVVGLSVVSAWVAIDGICILLIVLLPTTGLVVQCCSALLSGARSSARTRRFTVGLVGGAVTLAAVGLLGVFRLADQSLTELSAVDPGGWHAFQASPDGGASRDVPLSVVEAETPSGIRQVSYPDAVELKFYEEPPPNEVVGLVRVLSDLSPGSEYQFYVQIFDPGTDPTEMLSVSLNDRVVWQRQSGPTSGWQYVSLPWHAAASNVTIRVERHAGTDTIAESDSVPLVRTLHLYPKY